MLLETSMVILVVVVIVGLRLLPVSGSWKQKIVLGIGLISLLIGFILLSQKEWISGGILVGMPTISTILFLFVYFVLAPKDIFFTFVKEGTVKVITVAEQFHGALIQWHGWTLDERWNVVEGRESHWMGGLRWVGVWPIYKIYTYNFQWTGVKENGEFEFHPAEELNYVLVKEDVYGIKVEGAEDMKLLPLDINLTLTVRIVNPYKALFAIQNWFEATINRIRPYVRDFVTTRPYEDLIRDLTRMDRGIWQRLRDEDIIAELRDQYGVRVRKIETISINPKPEHREATLKAYLGEKEAERQSIEWVEMVLHAMARSRGINIEEIREEIQGSEDLQREFKEYIEEMNMRIEEADRGALLDIRVPNSEGAGNCLIPPSAVLGRLLSSQRTPSGGSAKENNNSQSEDSSSESLPGWLEEGLS